MGECLNVLTAYTITDAQIRELQRDLGNAPNSSLSDRMLLDVCRTALFNLNIGYCAPHERRHYERRRHDARARCAEFLNSKPRVTPR
jgi:hypothetical protein